VKDAGDAVPRTIPVGPQLNHCAADVPRLSHRPSEDTERPIGSIGTDDRPDMARRGPAAEAKLYGQELSRFGPSKLVDCDARVVKLAALLPIASSSWQAQQFALPQVRSPVVVPSTKRCGRKNIDLARWLLDPSRVAYRSRQALPWHPAATCAGRGESPSQDHGIKLLHS
jgi:hypothetical protein